MSIEQTVDEARSNRFFSANVSGTLLLLNVGA